MAGRGRTTFQKKQKEQARAERRQAKAARKQLRKANKEAGIQEPEEQDEFMGGVIDDEPEEGAEANG
jgi:hypothetical protein